MISGEQSCPAESQLRKQISSATLKTIICNGGEIPLHFRLQYKDRINAETNTFMTLKEWRQHQELEHHVSATAAAPGLAALLLASSSSASSAPAPFGTASAATPLAALLPASSGAAALRQQP